MLRLLSRTALPFAAVLSVTSAILAFGGPRTPAPDAGRAIMHGDQLLLAQSQTVCEIQTRTRTVRVNGQDQEQTCAVTCPKSVLAMRQVIGGNFRVMTVGGERLSDEQAAVKLAAETDVLVSASGKVLDPAYQTLYPPETLIVYLRPEPPCDDPYAGPAAPRAPSSVVGVPMLAPSPDGPPPPKFPAMPPAKGRRPRSAG